MERTADRWALHFCDDFHTFTPSDARPRPPSLILFSLDLVLSPFLYIVFVVGGLALLFAPFERARRRSRWALGLLVTAGGLLLVKGAAELLLHYSVWTPSPGLQRTLPHHLDFIAGVVLGIFLALGFSGELVGRKDPDIAKPI